MKASEKFQNDLTRTEFNRFEDLVGGVEGAKAADMLAALWVLADNKAGGTLKFDDTDVTINEIEAGTIAALAKLGYEDDEDLKA